MLPIILNSIANGGTTEMTVTGSSMRPLLKDRVSSVRLTKPDELKKGDIVLFENEDGHLVLHRIFRCDNGLYDMLGDNCRSPERSIPRERIIAKVCAYSRTGKKWKSDDPLYRFALPAIKKTVSLARRLKKRAAI